MKKLIALILLASFFLSYSQKRALARHLEYQVEQSADADEKYINTLSDFSSATGKVFVIQGDIDLQAQTINIPDDTTLKFEGGKVYNGTLSYGDNVYVKADAYEIFGTTTLHIGKLNRTQADYPEWFGVKVGLENKYNNYYAYAAWTLFAQQMNGSHLLHTNINDFYYLPDRNPVDNGTPFSNGGYDWENNQGIVIIPSNVTFTSLNGVTIKLDGDMVYTSGTSGSWRVLRTNDQTKNVRIFNNHFIGNRDIVGDADQQHLLMTYYDNQNIIVEQNVIEHFGGDAWLAQTAFNYRGGNTTNRAWELGSINVTTGAFEASTTKVRTTAATPYDLTPFDRYYMLMGASYGAYLGVRNGTYTMLFYDVNDNFLEAKRDLKMYEKVDLVENATYAHILLNQTNIVEEWGSREGQPINPSMQDLFFTDNAKFINNTCKEMGRQVISITGFQNLIISENVAYNITGAPGTFADFEDARELNRYIEIFNNFIKDYKGGIFLFNAVSVNIHHNHFERGSKTSLLGTFHINVPELSEDINIHDNIMIGGEVRISEGCILKGNQYNLTEIEMNGGTSMNNVYKNSTLVLRDSPIFMRDAKETFVVQNELFFYDNQALFDNAQKADGFMVLTTPERSNVFIENIKIVGSTKNATFRSSDANASIKNINHISETSSFIRSYGTGLQVDGITTPTLQQWDGDMVIENGTFDTVLRGSNDGTITLIDPVKPFNFTGKLAVDKVLYTSPNANCESFADNATAVSALGVGYYYKDSSDSNKFKITY